MRSINTNLKELADFVCKIIENELLLQGVCCETIQQQKYLVRINWKLKNDKSRPNKSSKVILVVFDQEVLSTYQVLNLSAKKDAKNRIETFLKNKLSYFDSNNNSPNLHHPPSTEEWEITQNILLGENLK